MPEHVTDVDAIRYATYMGAAPQRIPHWEHWSCPDAETYITGIDYYEHPRLCRLRMNALYPLLDLPVPASDEPVPRPALDLAHQSSAERAEGGHAVRWGEGLSWTWDWGRTFEDIDAVLRFSPLEHADFRKVPVVESHDYRDEEGLYAHYRANYPSEWGDAPPEGVISTVGFYNTMFMWPLLTFGWELFLEACLDPRFARVMDEFAEINRRVFRSFARLPVNFVICHDDIVSARGPHCSPRWMHRYIFPRYEEFWGILRAAGKRIIFMADGCMDAHVDDVFACGATGIVTEPYTDFRTIARRYPDCIMAGEGDNRVLYGNRPKDIEAMVHRMVETARMCGGYFMCLGNHTPWNLPPEAVKRYLDLCAELAHR